MQFQPKPVSEIEKEKATRGAWPIGDYPFEVLQQANVNDKDIFTEERQSQSGNDMIQLVISVTHPIGVKRVVRDYLLGSNQVKLYEASVACGLLTDFNAGKLTASNFVGKRGTLRLGIEKGKDSYPDKNKVDGYISGATDQPASVAATTPAKDEVADDLPF